MILEHQFSVDDVASDWDLLIPPAPLFENIAPLLRTLADTCDTVFELYGPEARSHQAAQELLRRVYAAMATTVNKVMDSWGVPLMPPFAGCQSTRTLLLDRRKTLVESVISDSPSLQRASRQACAYWIYRQVGVDLLGNVGDGPWFKGWPPRSSYSDKIDIPVSCWSLAAGHRSDLQALIRPLLTLHFCEYEKAWDGPWLRYLLAQHRNEEGMTPAVIVALGAIESPCLGELKTSVAVAVEEYERTATPDYVV